MLRKSGAFLFLVAIFAMIVSCATTEVASVKSAALSTTDLTRIAVFVPFTDIELREKAEQSFVESLSRQGFQGVRSIELLPPLKEYTNQKFGDVIRSNNITAIILVALTDAYSKQSYVPQSSRTNFIGNTAYTSTSGGYYVSKPRVKYEITLISTMSAEVVWKATTFTRGNAFAGDNELLESLAQESISKLAVDIKKGM